MYYELQDALGYRMDQNAPFNPTYSIASLPVSQLPINPNAPPPPKALLVPGGVQPDLKMPTLISWTLGVEQQVTPNTTFTLRYVGSHGYHEIVGIDANTPVPTICPAVAVSGGLSQHLPGWTGGHSGAGGLVLHSGRNGRRLTPRWRIRGRGSGGRQPVQRAGGRLQPALQQRSRLARRVHLVEGAGRRRLGERHHGRQCAWTGFQSLRHPRRLGTGDLSTCEISA